jgi:hypothetical protein
MEHQVSGAFDVTLAPLSPAFEESQLARRSIDKRFHGALDAASKGEMLSAGNPAAGSAGYVAMERVDGTLAGRAGTFSLQHSATMHAGARDLRIAVVPGSGTGELAGLSGSMGIRIEADGSHYYDFTYALPA